MTTIRQKVTEEVLRVDERTIQSTFVYQCLLIDGLEREYDNLALKVNRLLDLLDIPGDSIEERLELAKEML